MTNFFDEHMKDGNVVTITHMDGKDLVERCGDRVLAEFVANANAPVCIQVYNRSRPTRIGTMPGSHILTQIYSGASK